MNDGDEKVFFRPLTPVQLLAIDCDMTGSNCGELCFQSVTSKSIRCWYVHMSIPQSDAVSTGKNSELNTNVLFSAVNHELYLQEHTGENWNYPSTTAEICYTDQNSLRTMKVSGRTQCGASQRRRSHLLSFSVHSARGKEWRHLARILVVSV